MPTTKTTDEKALPAAATGVEVGDPVHYVWPDSGHHHAATVANVLDAERGYVTLSVLDHNGAVMQSPWVAFDADGAPGTWHLKEKKDDADKLDPAGLNIAADGTTPVPTGLTAEVPGARTDEERAAEARVPRTVLKDDPHGHRVADVAARTDSADAVDRSAITETAGERVAAAERDGTRAPSDPAARNAANEPGARRLADLAAQDATRSGRTGGRTETGVRTGPGAADREANRSTEANSAKTDPTRDDDKKD